MALDFQKKKIIDEYKIHETDTGSVDVQVALITARINRLLEHLKVHKKDKHSRRGLLMLIGKRQRLLKYLKGHDNKRYEQLVNRLRLK